MSKDDKKTKILAVGDIHGDRGLVKKLAKKGDQEAIIWLRTLDIKY